MSMFNVTTEIEYGENALDHLKKKRWKKAFIVADPFVVSGGLIGYVTSRLQSAGTRYVIFDEVVPDPPIEKIVSGVIRMLREEPDCMIAVGGGSAIDTAKAMRLFASEMGLSGVWLIAVPTTSGTGSEVTSFAVVSDPAKGRKYPLVSSSMTPDEAILDELMVKSVPAATTADTGMDVMTHAIEAYVSTHHNEFSAALSEKAIEICNQFLVRSYMDNTDAHARRKMHIASCMAGLAFNAASLGLNHGMAHQLGAQFHIPHGRANAVLLPHVVEYNCRIGTFDRSRKEYDPCVKRYCYIGQLIGVNTVNEVTTIHALIAYLNFMNHIMGIPAKVSEIVKVSEQEYMAKVPLMARAALEDACTATNPRKPTLEEVEDLYKKIW